MILGLLAALAGLLLPMPTGAQKLAPARAPEHFRLVPLASGIYAAIARPGDPDAAGNSGFVVGEEAVLVIDSFAAPAAARELLAQIRRTTKLPVRWVVNSLYDLDHVGGNAVFAREGAAIIAHENAREQSRTADLGAPLGAEQTRKTARPVLPEVTHRQGLTVWLGSRRVEVLFRPGHAGGDSVVRVPDADVVFAGDLFCNATVPSLAGADTAAWQSTLEGFLSDYPRATFVPGHGEPGRALDVRFFRDYVFGLRQTVGRAIEQGISGPALIDAVLPLHRARFGAWSGFDRFAAENIESTEQELRGAKRYAPTPK